MESICVTSFANSLLSPVLKKLLSFYTLCQNKIDINMIKIFLQNLSASKFKKSNFTNHRERGIVDLYWNEFLSLSFSRSAVIKPGRDHGDEFCVHVEYAIILLMYQGPDMILPLYLFYNFCFIILLICRVILSNRLL